VTGPSPNVSSPSTDRVGKYIEDFFARGTAIGEDGKTYPIPQSVTRGRASFVRQLCCEQRAVTSVETGMAWGVSTLHILQALLENGAGPRAHVVMDPAQSGFFHNAAIRAVRDLGLAGMIEFHEQPSELVLPRLLAEERGFDFAYIDGNHEFGGAFIDFFYINRMLKPGGVFVIDDYNLHPVRLTCDYAERYHGYTPVGESFDGVVPHKGRRWFGLGSPVPPLPWIRAYRKPAGAYDSGSFRVMPMYMAFSQYRRYASNQLRRRGLQAQRDGDIAQARRDFIEAIKMEPDRFKPYLSLARTFMPVKIAALGGNRAGR
jgi:predicted O-methyltransferase YrrM